MNNQIAGPDMGWGARVPRKGTAMRPIKLVLALFAIALLVPRPASASFHLMQIEQVVGGLNGNANIADGNRNLQAVQLRMRSSFQNLVSNGRLVVYDATGSNPVILSSPTTNVPIFAAGSRILLATAGFSAVTTPNVTPDFILANKIPDSYLAAGSLTFEGKTDGIVLWRLSWGGAGYTGPTTGATTNDADGEFGPAFDGPLPSSSLQALRFKFSAGALSTNNANDYALTPDAATFTNNAGASGTINSLVDVGPGFAEGPLALVAPAPNPVAGSMSYAVVVPREMQVEVRVQDVTGRVVRSLVNQTLPAGRHSFTWAAPTAAALPNGIYFLELNAHGVRQARRFVLMR